MKLWKTTEQQDEGNKPERDIIRTSQTIRGPCAPVLLPEAGAEEVFSSFYRVFYSWRQSSWSWFQILYINLYVFVIKNTLSCI